MDNEQDIVNAFQSTVGSFFIDRQQYSEVHVLLIQWKENDVHPENELGDLRELFEQTFNFTVTSLSLPGDSIQAAARINGEVLDLVSSHCSSEDSLIILYYAGHCEPNAYGWAQWRAFQDKGPTLPWYITQQLLFTAKGDVLLILDCCHASLIMRGEKEFGRFELLAACATGRGTPIPGSRSFSKLLYKELPNHVENGVTVNDLCCILRENPRITETPVFHDFSRRKLTKINFRRLDIPQKQRYGAKSKGYIIFRASLSDDLTGLEIANWLKSAPPQNVTAVRIEAIVTKARRLQGLAHDTGELFPAGSIFAQLSTPAQSDIVKAFQNLDTVIAISSQLATNTINQGDNNIVGSVFSNIETSVDAVCEAVETPVLTQLDNAGYKAASKEKIVEGAGATAAISLMEICHDIKAIQEDGEISPEKVHLKSTLTRFVTGTLLQQDIVVEIYHYNPDPSSFKPYPEAVKQVRKMAALLCHTKHKSFHILSCMGFFHDKVDHFFGLAFKPPPYFNNEGPPLTLLDLYDREPRVPLGHRIQLTYALTVALDQFLRVGWVHKAIRSANVAFFPMGLPKLPGSQDASAQINIPFTAELGTLDLARPYLFGFEYVRMGDAGTNLQEDYSLDRNLYRHPDRWGRPLLPYARFHDVYALGIVLVEIAFWQRIEYVAGIDAMERPISGADVQQSIVKKCRSRLPHQVGDTLSATIMACFEFGEATKGMDNYAAQKHYQTQISGRIQKAIGRV